MHKRTHHAENQEREREGGGGSIENATRPAAIIIRVNNAAMFHAIQSAAQLLSGNSQLPQLRIIRAADKRDGVIGNSRNARNC